MKYQLAFATLAILASTSSVFADGDKGLNGGGGEIEFAAIKKELVSWIDARAHEGKLGAKLNLAQSGVKISESALQDRFETAVKRVGNRVKFQDAPIKLPGYSTAAQGRICANDSDRATIVCNNARWAEASPQIKYAIVFHEYLGVAEIESNQGEYSRYPISSNILNFVKRSEKFELGAESTLLASCPELGFNGTWKNGAGGLFKIKQKGCMLQFLDMGRTPLLYKIPLNGSAGHFPDGFYRVLVPNGESPVRDLQYSVSIDSMGIPTLTFKGVATKAEWIGDVDFSFDMKIVKLVDREFTADGFSRSLPGAKLQLAFSGLNIVPRDKGFALKLFSQIVVQASELLGMAPKLNSLNWVSK